MKDEEICSWVPSFGEFEREDDGSIREDDGEEKGPKNGELCGLGEGGEDGEEEDPKNGELCDQGGGGEDGEEEDPKTGELYGLGEGGEDGGEDVRNNG